MTPPADHPETGELVVELRGRVAGDLVEYARHKIDAVLGHTHRPVLFGRVRVTRHPDPGRERPVSAQATIDLNGRPVHVSVEAGTPREAVDLLIDRLGRRLERVSGKWADQPDGSHHTRSRDTIRTRAVDTSPKSVAQAVGELRAGDRFHLFVESGRGVDSLLVRDEAGGIGLVAADGLAAESTTDTAGVTPRPDVPPVIDAVTARMRLHSSGVSFLFFVDAETGRGSVLFLRADLGTALFTLHSELTVTLPAARGSS